MPANGRMGNGENMSNSRGYPQQGDQEHIPILNSQFSNTQRVPDFPFPRVSVIMPTYNHAHFIRRALEGLLAQTFADWELIIVDDSSPDATGDIIAPFLGDKRIRHLRLDANHGVGAALNVGLDQARAALIAYLPSDDVWYPEHLASLVRCLDDQRDAVLAFSGVRHHYNKWADGQLDDYPLQLVQVLHRRTADRWIEREELVTDDLGRMLWNKLQAQGVFVGSGQASCEWVEHPDQLYKIIREPLGGINLFRSRFNVPHPLRFHSSVGNCIDEVAHYRRFRERPDTPRAADGLKILLVGELAYNAERVLALEERGHKLYGLWTPEPYWFNMVGPVPFGHVEDLPRNNWQAAIKRIKPDVVYALLNWQTVAWAHHVMQENPGVPFVWHFKEGPFICLEKGLWRELIELYTHADGQIYSSPEMRDWFNTVVPGLTDHAPSLVLDGDLPKRDWFDAPRSPRLSERDGQLHTVVPGRPIGLHAPLVGELAQQGVHLHFYGDYTQGEWYAWIADVNKVAAGFLHLYPNVEQQDWVKEFGQYDAGWLHFFGSQNAGELRRATWDDLNYPARIATLAVAGLPLLQRDNPDAIVATQTLARQHDIGLFFQSMEQLGAQLRDAGRMAQLRNNVWRQREQWMFDTHADELIGFFRRVIGERR